VAAKPKINNTMMDLLTGTDVTASGDSDPQVPAAVSGSGVTAGSNVAGSLRSSTSDRECAGVASLAPATFQTTSAETGVLQDAAMTADLISDLHLKIKTQDGGISILAAEIETLYSLIGTLRSEKVKASINNIHQYAKCLEGNRRNVLASMSSLTRRHNETVNSYRQAKVQETKHEAGAQASTKMCNAETQSPCWWDAESSLSNTRKRRDVKHSNPTQSVSVIPKHGKEDQAMVEQTKAEEPWTTVPGRKKKSANGKKKFMRNNSNVVIVESEASKYSEVLKSIKTGANMNIIGDKITALRQTKAGGILIQVAGGSAAADQVRSEVSKLVNTRVRQPTQRALVELRGLDSITSIDDIINDIVLNSDIAKEEVRIISLRKTYGETQAALVLMPLDSAARATKNGRMRIGLVYCSARICKRRLRCYRCLQFGHESKSCSGPDNSKCCRRCGISDHHAADCKASVEDAAEFRRSLFPDSQPRK